MPDTRPAEPGRAPPAWLLLAGAAALAGLAGTALALWGTRGPAMLLDLVAAYCF
jgi:hypothetical protein